MSFARALRLALAGGIGYALGSVPSARIAAQLAADGHVDVGTQGSRNPGALNAARLLGLGAGAAVAAADVGKGVLAGTIGRTVAGDLGAHVGSVAAVAGHCYPPWRGSPGGKGVATSYGQCLATFPAFAAADMAIALAATRLRVGRPALASVTVSSTCWIAAGAVWWRRAIPNLWGPQPSPALPLANAATTLVILSRAIAMLRDGEPDELALSRGRP